MKIKFYLLVFILFTASSTCFAQGEHVGGGNLTEGDMKYFITKLDRYLQSVDGKVAFPELAKYDETHKDATIHMIAQSLNPTLKDGEVLDSFGNPRDCVSYSSPVRYFKCNSKTLPDNTLEHQPSFYRLVFHEILVQAGLEVPVSKEISSEYPIASKLDVHLETFEEWVPGKTIGTPEAWKKSFKSDKTTHYTYECAESVKNTLVKYIEKIDVETKSISQEKVIMTAKMTEYTDDGVLLDSEPETDKFVQCTGTAPYSDCGGEWSSFSGEFSIGYPPIQDCTSGIIENMPIGSDSVGVCKNEFINDDEKKIYITSSSEEIGYAKVVQRQVYKKLSSGGRKLLKSCNLVEIKN